MDVRPNSASMQLFVTIPSAYALLVGVLIGFLSVAL